MDDWRRICCAVDFSEGSRVALERAAWLAKKLDAELIVTHVADLEKAQIVSPPELFEDSLVRGREELETWRARAQGLLGRKVTSCERHGSAVSELLRLIPEQKIDALVIGTHGRSGIGAVVFGSVANRLVRLAPCSVVTVRPPPK